MCENIYNRENTWLILSIAIFCVNKALSADLMKDAWSNNRGKFVVAYEKG